MTAFTLLYAVVGLPLGRLADTRPRNLMLASGLAVWSVLTFFSGLCTNFWQLFSARMGVGVGEASCAPAASSLIGDLYDPNERSRAMSVFMLGLPIGVSLSYLVGGYVAQHHGWRAVFYMAGLPGLFLAVGTVFLREPPRGQSEASGIGARQRPGDPIRVLLAIPTMRWIILSGLLHNFVMYALTFFLPSFLIRYHGTSVQMAGLLSAVLIGTVGALGMLVGGWTGDIGSKRWPHARMLISGSAVLLAAPAGFVALQAPRGSLTAFVIFQALAAFLMYTYYPLVYATIHDIVEPVLRGRAMAIYFFAMYTLGASLGPVATGWLSDHLSSLHRALYLIPALTLVLAALLFAGSATVGNDTRDLRAWMKNLNAEGAEEGESAEKA